MKEQYDVVIVGGAVIGSSIAYFLANNPDLRWIDSRCGARSQLYDSRNLIVIVVNSQSVLEHDQRQNQPVRGPVYQRLWSDHESRR